MGDLVQRLRGVLRFEEVPGELRVIGALEMEAADRIEALTAEGDALRLDLAAATKRAEAGMALADEAAQAVAEAQADIAEASAMCEELTALRARVAELEAGQTAAARDVLAERRRQVEVEGWTPEHDDQHVNGEMAGAAACYALYRSHVDPVELMGEGVLEMSWPWDPEWWKPTTRRRDLVKAAALILAEIERLDRAALSEPRT